MKTANKTNKNTSGSDWFKFFKKQKLKYVLRSVFNIGYQNFLKLVTLNYGHMYRFYVITTTQYTPYYNDIKEVIIK